MMFPSSIWARVAVESFQGNTFGVGLIVTQKSTPASSGRPLADSFHSIHERSAGVFGFRTDRLRSVQDYLSFAAHLGQRQSDSVAYSCVFAECWGGGSAVLTTDRAHAAAGRTSTLRNPQNITAG